MPPHPFAAGDRVRVIDGPLAGYEADVRRAGETLQLLVAVKAMRVPIETTPAQVEFVRRLPT
jgi:transcription antitermination factor NusG